MIKKIDNANAVIAKNIFSIFQCSYKIEAQLIGTLDFPPLSRSAKDIANCKADFYGFNDNNRLAAIIEIAVEGKRLEINSLTVDPKYFRKGIADKLLHYILTSFDLNEVIVETAVVNTPAINLYKKHGFSEFKRWTPSHGIEKLAMSVNLPI